MKKLPLLALLFIGCTSSKPEIKNATVISASLDILTPFDIDCDLLDSLLPSSLKTNYVANGDLTRLATLLSNPQTTSDTSIDVRGKLIVTTYDNKTKTLCFDKFAVFYDGAKYTENEPLLEFLKTKKLITP